MEYEEIAIPVSRPLVAYGFVTVLSAVWPTATRSSPQLPSIACVSLCAKIWRICDSEYLSAYCIKYTMYVYHQHTSVMYENCLYIAVLGCTIYRFMYTMVPLYLTWCARWFRLRHGMDRLNSLAPGKSQFNFREVIFKPILQNGGRGISYEIALRWMPLDFTDEKSALVQVTSPYLSQCWPRSMSPNGTTRPQWVNSGRTN